MEVLEEEGGHASEGSRSSFASPSSQISSPDPAAHTSPPLPPADFNPPVDFPSHSPAQTVSDPGSGSVSSPPIPGSLYPAIDPLAGPSAIEHLGLNRPRALQRVSNESMTGSTPGSVASSASSFSGDSGDHLVEMRDRLRWDTTTGGTLSRRSSISTSSAVESFRLNLINPTPPTEPVFEENDGEDDAPDAGPSRLTRLSPAALEDLEETIDLPAEHAWDSVWPAPGSVHRNVPPDIPGPSRFPIAPVSPFVTPAFSPAIIPITSSSLSRKPSSPIIDPHDSASPRRSHSPPISNPFRFSPRNGGTSPIQDVPNFPFSNHEMFYGGRRRSVTADAPLLAHSPPATAPISIVKHNRTFSSSSQNSPQGRLTFDRLQRASPNPHSPPKSPVRQPSSLPSDLAAPPTSPAFGKHVKSNLGSSSNTAATSKRPTNPGASPPTMTSALTKGRPRGRSLSSAQTTQNFREQQQAAGMGKVSPLPPRAALPSPQQASRGQLDDVQSMSTSSSSLPPIALPPPVAPPIPVPPDNALLGDDEMRSDPPFSPASPPLFAPLARPAILRRALSDYDAKARPAPSAFQRTLSITPELDKSPKRDVSSADLHSPLSPKAGGDLDATRARKSPKKSPQTLPMLSPLSQYARRTAASEDVPASEPGDYFGQGTIANDNDAGGELISEATHVGDLELVDEGDVRPTGEIHMDVTFDDEGLNTLERIFLLSKSEYPFHRSYVARVLGDLLNDVDPCESVEYVLPLLSGFSMDEDESVKEAFASELHRILWYFYSTCKLVTEDDASVGEDGEDDSIGALRVDVHSPSPSHHPINVLEHSPASPEKRKHTVTVTSEGVNVVPKPTPAEIAETAITVRRRASTISMGGPSSAGSSMRPGSSSTYSPADENGDVNTPASSISTSSQDTAYSPGIYIKPHAEDDEDQGFIKDAGALVDRPILSVSFFTPLLGSLLLNQNPVISESVRNGVVAVLGRLRGQSEISMETWGSGAHNPELDERKTFVTQNGPHQHDLRPFNASAKTMVERELLHGIIIGMGRLATDMPDVLFEEEPDTEEDLRDQEAFHLQLIQEATAGRATSMNLIGAVCEFFLAEEAVKYGFVDEVLGSADGDVPVRAEAAVAMSFLAKVAPVEHIYRMLSLFEFFCEDEDDHVKQSACLCLPALCKRIESLDYRRSFAIKGVQSLTTASEDVRCAALEMLGEVIYIFNDDPRGPPLELLNVYTDDSEVMPGWRDSDWDIVAMFNFPGVCLTLGSERWDDIRELFHRLQDRAGDKVTHTTAACLHELAKILKPEQVVEDILPVYSRLLEGSEETRERVFENVDVIIDSVPKDIGWQLFENLAQSWKDKTLGGWRAREKLSLHIPNFLKTFEGWHSVGDVLEMMRDALLDPFAAVRDAVTYGIPEAYEVLGNDTVVAKEFRQILLDLGDSRVFKQRLTFVRCLREFAKPPPNRDAFEEFFLPHLPRLAQDVVDVRLGLAQIIADLFVVGAYYAEVNKRIPTMIRELADRLAYDESVDVRDTIRKVDLTRLAKGQSVPHEVKPVERPDRAHVPDYLSPTSPSHPTSKLDSNQRVKDELDHSTSPTPTPSTVNLNQPSTPSQDRVEPQRRPSTEVHAKLSSMRLGVEPELDSGEPTPRVPQSIGTARGDGEEGQAVEGNPFAVSFAEAKTHDHE